MAHLQTLLQAPSAEGLLILWELLWIKVRIFYWKNFHLGFAAINASVAYWCAGEGNLVGAMVNIAVFGYMMMRWSAHREQTKNF